MLMLMLMLMLMFNAKASCQFIPIGIATQGSYGYQTKTQYDSLKIIAKAVLSRIDFHVGANVQGFSSLTTNVCYYQDLGASCLVHINFAGVSNQTYITFTLPFTSANFSEGTQQQFCVPIVKDAGSGLLTADGKVTITNNSTTATCYKTINSLTWTATLTKQISGTFQYFKQ